MDAHLQQSLQQQTEHGKVLSYLSSLIKIFFILADSEQMPSRTRPISLCGATRQINHMTTHIQGTYDFSYTLIHLHKQKNNVIDPVTSIKQCIESIDRYFCQFAAPQHRLNFCLKTSCRRDVGSTCSCGQIAQFKQECTSANYKYFNIFVCGHTTWQLSSCFSWLLSMGLRRPSNLNNLPWKGPLQLPSLVNLGGGVCDSGSLVPA